MGSKYYNTDWTNVWTVKEMMLKNKPNLATFHESILA